MTELMLPLLEKAAPDVRVITVSSGGMYTAPLTKDLQVLLFWIFQKLQFAHSMLMKFPIKCLNAV